MNLSREHGFEHGRRVAITWPEAWRDRETLDAGTLRRVEIRRAAIAVLCGVERRSFAEIAADLCCSKAAVSAAFVRLCRALNLESMLRRGPETRLKLSASTARNWAKRNGRQTTNPAAVQNNSYFNETDKRP